MCAWLTPIFRSFVERQSTHVITRVARRVFHKNLPFDGSNEEGMPPSSPADNSNDPRTSTVHYSNRPPEPSASHRSNLYGPRPTDNQGGYGWSSPHHRTGPSRQPRSMPIGSDDDGYISSNTTTTTTWGHSRPASRGGGGGAGPYRRDADRQDGHGDQSGGSIAVVPLVGSTTGIMTGIDRLGGLEGTGRMAEDTRPSG